jgi:hypothetical protein
VAGGTNVTSMIIVLNKPGKPFFSGHYRNLTSSIESAEEEDQP